MYVLYSYDVEADVQLVLQDAENKSEVADKVLQHLNVIPLPIQKKLALSRYSDGLVCSSGDIECRC